MHLADDPVVSPEIKKTANYGCWASACRYVFRQITAASLSRKVWINGRMSTGSQWTSPAPGKPTDNPVIESFNGSLRDECLNIHWFLSLEDAQGFVE